MSIKAQDTTAEKTKFEQFKSRTGRMFRTDVGQLGKVKGLTFTLDRIIDLETGDSSKALIVVGSSGSMWFGTYNVGYVIIDYDDIMGIIKALVFYKKQIQLEPPTYEPTYQYFTSNRISIDCFFRDESPLKGWTITVGRGYYLSSHVLEMTLPTKVKDLDDVINMLKHSLEVNFKF